VVDGGWWTVCGGWWLVVGGWWLVVRSEKNVRKDSCIYKGS